MAFCLDGETLRIGILAAVDFKIEIDFKLETIFGIIFMALLQKEVV